MRFQVQQTICLPGMLLLETKQTSSSDLKHWILKEIDPGTVESSTQNGEKPTKRGRNIKERGRSKETGVQSNETGLPSKETGEEAEIYNSASSAAVSVFILHNLSKEL